MGKGSSETATQRMGEQDQAYINQVRTAAGATSAAAAGGVWAEGPNQYQQDAAQRWGDVYGAGQDMYNRGMQGWGNAMQQGLNGLSAYTDPLMADYGQYMNPVFDRMRGQRQMGIAQDATRQGAYGGSRSAVAASLGDAQQNELEGNFYLQALMQNQGMGLGAMMQDRQRGLQGALFAGGGLNAMAGANQQAGQTGELFRNIDVGMNMDPYTRSLAAQQAQMGGFMGPMEQSNTTEKSGNLFGDILGLGLTGASFFFPPAAAAAQATQTMNGLGGNEAAAANWNPYPGGLTEQWGQGNRWMP